MRYNDLIPIRNSILLGAGFLLALALGACSGQSQEAEALLGTWRQQRTQGIHTILAFRNNGTFEVDQRIEGRLSKIVEKRGKASGRWEIQRDQNRLTLITEEGDPRIGWPARTVAYQISAFDSIKLDLVSPEGRHQVWKRIRSKQADSAAEKEGTVVKSLPMVVNLAPGKTRSEMRYQWICTQVDMMLERDVPGDLPARVREKIIFYLSARSYDEMNTHEKLTAAARRLKDALNPFMGDRIVGLSFNNTVLTGRPEVVDEFMASYAAVEKASVKE